MNLLFKLMMKGGGGLPAGALQIDGLAIQIDGLYIQII